MATTSEAEPNEKDWWLEDVERVAETLDGDEAVDEEENNAEDLDEDNADWEAYEDVDQSPHTMLAFSAELLSRIYQTKSSSNDSGDSSAQLGSPLIGLPVEVQVMVIRAMPPLTRCAFALTYKNLATIACDNVCLELGYDERFELTGQPRLTRDWTCSCIGFMEASYVSQCHWRAKQEIELMGGMYTQGIAEACYQWWFTRIMMHTWV